MRFRIDYYSDAAYSVSGSDWRHNEHAMPIWKKKIRSKIVTLISLYRDLLFAVGHAQKCRSQLQ